MPSIKQQYEEILSQLNRDSAIVIDEEKHTSYDQYVRGLQDTSEYKPCNEPDGETGVFDGIRWVI